MVCQQLIVWVVIAALHGNIIIVFPASRGIPRKGYPALRLVLQRSPQHREKKSAEWFFRRVGAGERGDEANPYESDRDEGGTSLTSDARCKLKAGTGPVLRKWDGDRPMDSILFTTVKYFFFHSDLGKDYVCLSV